MEALRAQIRGKTRAHRDLGNRRLARTVHVILAPAFAALPDRYCTQYPGPPDGGNSIRPWIVPADGHDIESEIADGIAIATSLETTAALAAVGYSVLDQANQIIVVCDLRDENAMQRLQECVAACRAAIARRGLGESDFALICVAIHGVGAEASTAAELAELEKVSAASFDRTFVLEHHNSGGLTISSEEMLDLVGQLLMTLGRMPEEPGLIPRGQTHVEWLKSNSAAEGRITGFAAGSVVLPIEVIAEQVIRGHSVRVLRHTLFADPDPDRVRHHAESVLTACHLQSLQETCAHLATATEAIAEELPSHGDEPGSRPNRYDSEMFGDLHSGVSFLCAQHAALAGYLRRRAEALEPVLDAMQQDLATKLDDSVAAALTSDIGCVQVAQQAVARMQERLDATLKDPGEQEAAESPVPTVADVVNSWNGGPDGLALFVRAVVAMGFLAAMAIGIAGIPPEARWALMAGAALVGGGAAVRWATWRANMKSKMAQCWTTLIEYQKERERSAMVSALMARRMGLWDVFCAMEHDLESLSGRLIWLLDAYGQHELPEEGTWSTLWQRAPLEAADLQRLADLVAYDPEALGKEVLMIDRPFVNWRVITQDGSEVVKEPEWVIMERVAARLLTHADRLFATSVGDVVPVEPERIQRLRSVLGLASRPFLKLNPVAPGGTVRARFEMPSSFLVGPLADIPSAMKSQFDSIDVARSDPYRVSLMTFLDDLRFDSLRTAEEVGG